MGARDLLNDLAQAGLTVSADGDSIVIRPSSLLNDALRARVRDTKSELLALLGEAPTAVAARRERLLRWGWPAAEAEALAERLALRDHEPDGGASCVDCLHYRPGRCSNHRRAALQSTEVGRDLAEMRQHCPAFMETTR